MKLNIFGKKSKGKVFVGLSGGVDSAVSAALLKKAGYDVTCVFIRIALLGYPCSAGEDKRDALRVASALELPFVEIDLSKNYTDTVFKNMVDEFKAGRTPNPDTLCNREIKFGAFYDFARAHGADFVATGHYAQTRDGLLYQGADPSKEQSYFLWMVKRDILKHTLFPVGGMHKTRVRELARKFGLPNATRKDSQGLCFLGDLSIDDMLHKELSPTPGDVVSEKGEVIGAHDGAALYTLGQRHGFELFAKTPETKPHFVIGKDTKLNTITVSENRFPHGATRTYIELTDTNWIGMPAQAGERKVECMARYRYHQTLIPATLSADGTSVVLHEAHYVPLGQSLVLYSAEDGRCLGGGIVHTSKFEQ